MSSQPFTTNSAAVVTTTAHVRPMSGEQAALVARFASPTIARVRRNSVRLISLTALAMSMAACNTIPKADSRPVLAEPNIPIEQSYGAFDKETASNAAQPSIAGQRWQNFYSDERLKGLINCIRIREQ